MSGEILIGFREDTDTGKNIRGVSYDYPLPVADSALVASRGLGRVAANNKFGFNPQIDTTTDPETIWTAGGVFVKQLTAETVNLASSSTSDASAGNGARTVLVSYLDGDYAEVSEIVVLNGTSNVALSQQCIAINRMSVLTAGSGKENAGTINATGASSGDLHAQIPRVTDEGSTIGSSITQQLVYTVPAGKEILIESLLLNVLKTTGGATPTITFRGILENSSGVRLLWLHQKLDSQRQSEFQINFPTAVPIGEKVTVSIEVLTDVSGSYASARMWFKEYTA